MGTNAGNAFTEVPPMPPALGSQLDDCNSDEGSTFNFATYNWSRGTIAVFNRGASAVTFSLTSLVNGAALTGYQNISVPAGSFVHNVSLPDLGLGTYQLTATGPVTLWAGDQEGGGTIAHMGDDVTFTQGARGQAFLVHTATQGATPTRIAQERPACATPLTAPAFNAWSRRSARVAKCATRRPTPT